MPKKFQRTIENFICGQCGAAVRGNGYTNHCPHCLWSRHVDINPGDRQEPCGGLMEPSKLEIKNNKTFIIHKCQQCGFEKKNKVSEADNREAIIELAN